MGVRAGSCCCCCSISIFFKSLSTTYTLYQMLQTWPWPCINISCTCSWGTRLLSFISLSLHHYKNRIVELSCFNVTVVSPVGRITGDVTHLNNVALSTTPKTWLQSNLALRSSGMLSASGHAFESLVTNYKQYMKSKHKLTCVVQGHLNMVYTKCDED